MTDSAMESLETKSDTQSIDSNNSKMNKIFQNDDIQKAIDQVDADKLKVQMNLSKDYRTKMNIYFLVIFFFTDNSIGFD